MCVWCVYVLNLSIPNNIWGALGISGEFVNCYGKQVIKKENNSIHMLTIRIKQVLEEACDREGNRQDTKLDKSTLQTLW